MAATAVAKPLCVAIDTGDAAHARRIVEATSPYAGAFKIGLHTFTALGPRWVEEVAASEPVFADLKLHDIPAQVGGAVGAVRDLGASYVTVHATGGAAMIAAAAAAAGDDLVVLAVTVLTSLGDDDLAVIGLAGPAPDAVVRLAGLALDAGAHGVVCSPLEVAAVRSRFGDGPVVVVPGVRSEGATPSDQVRTATAAEAVAAGADLIVVGRPITAAPDPAAAARRLIEEAGR